MCTVLNLLRLDALNEKRYLSVSVHWVCFRNSVKATERQVIVRREAAKRIWFKGMTQKKSSGILLTFCIVYIYVDVIAHSFSLTPRLRPYSIQLISICIAAAAILVMGQPRTK